MKSSLWPVLRGTGVFLGLGMPLANAAAAQQVGALGFALWPAAAAGLVLAIPAVIDAANVYRSVRLPQGLAAEWHSGLTLLSSAALLALFGSVASGLQVPPTAAALSWLALQAAARVAGYVLCFLLQQRAEPVTFSFMGYVVMATGVAAGTVFFGERLPWTTGPALACIGTALWLISRTPAPRPTALLRTGGRP